VACAAVRTADLRAAAARIVLQVGLRASQSNDIRCHLSGMDCCRDEMHEIGPEDERRKLACLPRELPSASVHANDKLSHALSPLNFSTQKSLTSCAFSRTELGTRGTSVF
jgi:hypothetical protein